jgi:hypothetical protein
MNVATTLCQMLSYEQLYTTKYTNKKVIISDANNREIKSSAIPATTRDVLDPVLLNIS